MSTRAPLRLMKLQLALHGCFVNPCIRERNSLISEGLLVTGAGIEPAARALKVRCSTTELPGHSVGRSSFVIGQLGRRLRADWS